MIYGSVGDFGDARNGCVTGGGNTRDMGGKVLIWLAWVGFVKGIFTRVGVGNTG